MKLTIELAKCLIAAILILWLADQITTTISKRLDRAVSEIKAEVLDRRLKDIIYTPKEEHCHDY